MAPKRSLDEYEGDDEFAAIEGATPASNVLDGSAPKMKRHKTHHASSEQDATRKRKYDLYKLDAMGEDISSADSDESEFQYPRVSTPLSVKYPRFDLSYDSNEEVESSPPSSSSLATLVGPSPFDGYDLINVADDYYLSEEDDESLQQAKEETPLPRMIRRRTAYGVVSVPVTSDDEEEEYVASDEEGSEADDEDDDTTEPWNEREQQIFLVLVCDFGRNWRRFQPFFPHMSVDDLQDHFNHVVSQHPEYGLDEVADAADQGAQMFSPPRRFGRWAHAGMGSDRLVLGGSAIEPDYVMPEDMEISE